MDNVLKDALWTGADGMMGSYVTAGVRPAIEELDVTHGAKVLEYVALIKPKIIVHLAALTDMNLCEKEPELAYAVNVQGTEHVALAAREVGALMVYVSTNAVFDGAKDEGYTSHDIPNPVSVYGRTKYEGENVVKKIAKDYLIARTSWIFGGGPKKDHKFVKKILDQAEYKEIKAVNDVLGTPTYAKDFLSGLSKLIDEGKRGIFHIANSGRASRFNMASVILKICNSQATLSPVSIHEFKSAYPVLHNESLVSDVLLRPWQEALEEYITHEWKTEHI